MPYGFGNPNKGETKTTGHTSMKLLINRDDIIKAFASKTGFEAHEIEIEIDTVETSAPSIQSEEIRTAIATIYREAMDIQDQYREGKKIIPNIISLIKAVRILDPNSGLRDARDYVESLLATGAK